MVKSIGRLFILIMFLCIGKTYAQNATDTRKIDFFEIKQDSLHHQYSNLYHQFDNDLILLKSSEKYHFDSSSFLKNLKLHREKMSMTIGDSYVDPYLDSLINIQYIYFKRFNTAEEYAIMIAGLLYCRSAVDSEWMFLYTALMLYYYPNKIYEIEKYAQLVGKRFKNKLMKELALICASEIIADFSQDDIVLFKMAYPYFYKKYKEQPFKNLANPEKWLK